MLTNFTKALASRSSSSSLRSLATATTTNRSLFAENKDGSVIKAAPSQPAARVEGEATEIQELKTHRPLLYPDQMQWLDDRQVRISKPSKNVMQSGTANTKMWKIEFDSQPRWENWLMGWTSTADPMSNLTMNFPTKEAAIAFCDRNKLNWFVEEQPDRKIRRKSYADNFSWNKRTRLGNK